MSDPFGISKGIKVENYLKLRKVALRGEKGSRAQQFAEGKYNLRFQRRNTDPTVSAENKKKMADSSRILDPVKRKNQKGIF